MPFIPNPTRFPVDWERWRLQWHTWRLGAGIQIHATARPEGYPKEPNMLADEVLGWFTCPKGTVELSEVVFRIREPERFIGYAFAPHLEGETGVVDTFADLERVLGLTEEADATT